MITSTDPAIADWLAHAHKAPLSAQLEWTEHGIAMLPLGSRFDAVRIPAEIVHAAAGSDEWQAVADVLGKALDGPVIHDPYTWYYALVPPRTTESWRSPLARCVGRGAWLGVPRTDRITPCGLYWAVVMGRAGRLCDPDDVAGLIRRGHE